MNLPVSTVAGSLLLAVGSHTHNVPQQKSGPWAFHAHLLAWILIGLVVGARYLLTRNLASLTRRRRWSWAGGIAALLICTSWPLADLAAHWSLTALLFQRVLLTLVAAPLLMLGCPPKLLATLTKPRFLDEILKFVTRPAPAIVIFSVVSFGSLLVPSVRAQSSSSVARAIFDVVILAAGFVLWGPVIRNIPGASRPTAVGTAVYLFVQSVLPGFPVVIFVFSKHAFYPSFAEAHRAIGLSPLADQQLAAVLGKVATLPVLWTVAWRRLSVGAQADSETQGVVTDEDWQIEDVERHLERSARESGTGR